MIFLKKIGQNLITLGLLFIFVSSPLLVEAWRPGDDIAPCGFDGSKSGAVDGVVSQSEQCEFVDFIKFLGNIIDLLLWVSTLLAAVSFAYAGFLYATSGGNPGKISSAHRIFGKVATGFIVALSAWLIVKMIETALLGSGAATFLT